MSWTRLSAALAFKSIRRPSTGVALLKVGWRFRRRRWWAQFPFLPIPDGEYVRWRMYTAYGDEDITPPAADVERYARWAASDP